MSGTFQCRADQWRYQGSSQALLVLKQSDNGKIRIRRTSCDELATCLVIRRGAGRSGALIGSSDSTFLRFELRTFNNTSPTSSSLSSATSNVSTTLVTIMKQRRTSKTHRTFAHEALFPPVYRRATLRFHESSIRTYVSL